MRANVYNSKLRKWQRSDFMFYDFNSACQSQAPPFIAVSRCKLAGTVCHTLATFSRKEQSPWLLIDALLDQMLFFFLLTEEWIWKLTGLDKVTKWNFFWLSKFNFSALLLSLPEAVTQHGHQNTRTLWSFAHVGSETSRMIKILQMTVNILLSDSTWIEKNTLLGIFTISKTILTF